MIRYKRVDLSELEYECLIKRATCKFKSNQVTSFLL